MTFYIPAFWCGVFATIIFEISLVIVSVVVFAVKDGSKEANQIFDGEEGKNVHKGD